ncbi:MAG: sulfur carrier protein ThiS [Deltaproteobacteria bacterium]|nr:sulfur carrier protein ThiS [Deltaproteobacteria bacterium]MBI2975081.1 sulfur carrier protein ThiS [Deltaproteobacteria bacterium]
MASITLNGEIREIAGGEVLSDFLARLELNKGYLAVAVNESVIPRSEHDKTKLNGGEKIEVIQAVGGG